MSDRTLALQSFSTTVYSSKRWDLLPIAVLWMPRDANIKIDQSTLGRIARELRRGLPGETAFTLGQIDNEIGASVHLMRARG
jgi:hypothetical protein